MFYLCIFFSKVGSICLPHPIISKVLIILFLVKMRDVTSYYLLTLMSFLEQSIRQEGMSHFPAITKNNRSVHIFFPSFGLKCTEFPENQGRRGKQDGEEGSTQTRVHTCFMAVSTFISLYSRKNHSLYDFMTDTCTH